MELDNLIARLRWLGNTVGTNYVQEAADALAAQQQEIERLTAVVKAANAQAEHFEREWYLRGDEIERLTAERGALREELAAAQKDAERYRWIRSDKVEHARALNLWQYNNDTFDAAIDAAMA